MAGCVLPNCVRPPVSPSIDHREVLAQEGEEVEIEEDVGFGGERENKL